MQGTLVVDGSPTEASVASVTETVRTGVFFWLDLDGVDDEASGLLRDTLGFHPLALEDSEHFGQRPKIDEFDDFTFFVVHGTLPDGSGLVEMHIFFTEHGLVTVHRGECPALADVFRRMDHRQPPTPRRRWHCST
jgi:magnesium transporter